MTNAFIDKASDLIDARYWLGKTPNYSGRGTLTLRVLFGVALLASLSSFVQAVQDRSAGV